MLKIPSFDSNPRHEYRTATVMASVMIQPQYHCDVSFEMYDLNLVGNTKSPTSACVGVPISMVLLMVILHAL